MSLISIDEYTGSEIGKAVIEALDMVGIINKLNINGYAIRITGVQGKTPEGMIDDTPLSHVITIERNKYLGVKSKTEFNKIKENIVDCDVIINSQENLNIDFDDTNGFEISHEIERDESSYLWYTHRVEAEIKRAIVEEEDAYVKRIFETIANYVISTFEEMSKES